MIKICKNIVYCYALFFTWAKIFTNWDLKNFKPSTRGFQGEKYVKQKQYKTTILINLSFVLYISFMKNLIQKTL